MGASSIVLMIFAIVIIWGGLAVSIIHAVRKSKEAKRAAKAN